MKVVEIRVLEGPNYFLLEPSIKIEFDTGTGVVTDENVETIDQLRDFIRNAYIAATLHVPNIVIERMETPGHLALVFGWNKRRFSVRLAERIAEYIESPVHELQIEDEIAALATQRDESDDHPEMVSTGERAKTAIGVTGTNGKTTTTRLIAHIFSQAGFATGWSCSSGVYVNGEEVLSGDYSGPQGALRILRDPAVDVAVMELARGGILRRGIATESLDVSVFTNISADHLDLQGIHTIQGLSRTKAVVSRITTATGSAVLNADDPLVIDATKSIQAERVLISQTPGNPVLINHCRKGGRALVNIGGLIVACADGERGPVVHVDDIPMTYHGSAAFMIENALSAAAACWAAGLSIEQIRDGLRSFVNNTVKNPGRLNVFDLHGVSVIVDFAHNEAGLLELLNFARAMIGESGRIYSVVGTAGDRTDASIRALGKIAATWSDHIIAKDTTKYLRGRDSKELLGLYASGAREVGGASYVEAPSELEAVQMAVAQACAGDAVAIMGHEDAAAINAFLLQQGAHPL